MSVLPDVTDRVQRHYVQHVTRCRGGGLAFCKTALYFM